MRILTMPFFVTYIEDNGTPEDYNVFYSKLIRAKDAKTALQLAKKLHDVKYSMQERQAAHTCCSQDDCEGCEGCKACKACDAMAVDVVELKLETDQRKTSRYYAFASGGCNNTPITCVAVTDTLQDMKAYIADSFDDPDIDDSGRHNVHCDSNKVKFVGKYTDCCGLNIQFFRSSI